MLSQLTHSYRRWLLLPVTFWASLKWTVSWISHKWWWWNNCVFLKIAFLFSLFSNRTRSSNQTGDFNCYRLSKQRCWLTSGQALVCCCVNLWLLTVCQCVWASLATALWLLYRDLSSEETSLWLMQLLTGGRFLENLIRVLLFLVLEKCGISWEIRWFYVCVWGVGVEWGGLKGALKVVGFKLSCKKGNMEYQCSLGA